VYEFSSELWHIMYLISCVPYVVASGLMGYACTIDWPNIEEQKHIYKRITAHSTQHKSSHNQRTIISAVMTEDQSVIIQKIFIIVRKD